MKLLKSLDPIHWVAIAMFLGALGTHLGSADTWAEALKPASIGALLVQCSAFLMAMFSQRPGSQQPAKPEDAVSTSRFIGGGGVGAAAILVAVVLGASSCATLHTSSAQAVTTEQARLQEMSKVAAASTKIVTVAKSIQALEITLHDQHSIPDGAHRAVQEAFLQFGKDSQVALQAAIDTSKPDADRRIAIGSLIVLTDHLVGQLQVVLPPGSASQLQVAIDAIHAALTALQLSV